MLHANINQLDPARHFHGEPALLRALAWIRAMIPDHPDGIVELDDDTMYVNVHRYATQPREACAFESHRRYVDLQYCIAGGELIDYCRLDEVVQSRPYDERKDFLYHQPALRYAVLRMTPGDFAVFYPEDAHRPKVGDGQHDAVRKLVVKIDRGLLSKTI